MSPVAWGLAGASVGFVALVIATIVVFNLLVRRAALIEEAWGNVTAALVRRRDALPSISATLAGATRHELTVQQLAASQAAHASVVARDEALPELTTVRLTLAAQRELVVIEDDIQGTRLIFNRAVARYNVLVRAFPTSLVARAAGFREADYFEAETLLATVDFATAKG